MNGAYQIINFDDIEFTTGTAELVVGAYKKITDTAKRFVITHLNLDDEVYKDIQLTFENVEGTFVGTGVVNGKLAVVSIASTDQVTVSLNDIAGGITALQNALTVTDAKFNYSTNESMVGTWVDGRPIYRKVIDLGNMSDYGIVYDGTTQTISITNVTGLNDCFILNEFITLESDGSTRSFIQSNVKFNDVASLAIYHLTPSDTTICIIGSQYTSQGYKNTNKAYLIIEYCKPTTP